MDKVIGIYTSIIQTRTSPRFVQNLQWLLRLRQRAIDRIGSADPHANNPNANGADVETELDAGLLGWKTRFIERAMIGGRATTISGVNAPNQPTGGAIGYSGYGTTSTADQSPLEIDSVIQGLPQAVQDHVFSSVGGGSGGSGSGGSGGSAQIGVVSGVGGGFAMGVTGPTIMGGGNDGGGIADPGTGGSSNATDYFVSWTDNVYVLQADISCTSSGIRLCFCRTTWLQIRAHQR